MPVPDGAISTLAVAGVTLITLVVGLTQVIKEAAGVPSRVLPLVSIVIGVALVGLNAFAPPPLTQALVTGLALGVGAAMTIRFAKRGGGDGA